MDEDSFLPISALQHYVFCTRQCALIHIEQMWNENTLTAQGRVDHRIVHLAGSTKKASRAMQLHSFRLGLFGMSDMVEFQRYNGKDAPIPVEYKHGGPKKHKADEVQLCAQGMCLEEMFGRNVPYGEIFYARKKRRYKVVFDEQLRRITSEAVRDMHHMFDMQKTPPPVFTEYCKKCSLYQQCFPEALSSGINVSSWIRRKILQ